VSAGAGAGIKVEISRGKENDMYSRIIHDALAIDSRNRAFESVK
jgi:hypothetical protein